MMEELQNLMSQDIPEGRQSIKDSHTNLEKVAEYCEANYFQADNKTQALEESKRYTTQSLASVAYQINTLAFNLLHLLDLQTAQLSSVESQVNHIAQTVSIHKEKVARREIGVLTTNKNTIKQHKILAPANQEKPIKYVRKPIDYSILDGVGHAVRSQMVPINYSQTAPRPRRSSSSGPGPGPAGPAPTQKPPTPPAQQMTAQQMAQAMGASGSTLRRSDYRTPPAIAPPQLPSNYAPNYPVGPMGGQGPPRRSNSNCSTLPAAVHTSHLMHQQLGPYRQGMMAGIQRPQEAGQHMSMSGHFGGHFAQHPSVDSSSSIGVTQEMLPAPPPTMMASHPPQAVPTSTMGSLPAHIGGNISPPLPPPPEELASPHTPPPAAPASDHVAQMPRGSISNSSVGRNSGEPAWAPATYLEKVIAMYDYQADKADELSFSEQAVIYVIKKNDDGWYEGVMNGVQGLFPGNYVEPCM